MDIKHVQDDESYGSFIVTQNTYDKIAHLRWAISMYDRHAIEIRDIFIPKMEHRGKGIGSKLINLLLEHANTLDVDKIIGVTQADDPLAHAFYEKHGFHFPTPDKFILSLGKR